MPRRSPTSHYRRADLVAASVSRMGISDMRLDANDDLRYHSGAVLAIVTLVARACQASTVNDE